MWPICAIVAGVILLAFTMLREGREQAGLRLNRTESADSNPPVSA